MSSHTIGLFEAKTRLSEVVARVEAGEEVVITRHQRPVAKLVPMDRVPGVDLEQRRLAVKELLALREEIRKNGGGMSTQDIVGAVREMREEQTDKKTRAAGLPW